MGDILSGFQVTDLQVNSMANTLYYVIIAAFLLGLFGFLIFKFINKLKHNIHVVIHKKIGNAIVKEEDWVMKDYYNGQYFFHYLYMNKRSPIVDDKYMKIVNKYRFGIRLPNFKYSVMGFDANFEDGKMMPMETNKLIDSSGNLTEVTFNGVDYDMFNFMKAELEAYFNKKKKDDKLMQLAPYLALLVIVVAFIVGQTLYTQHLEKMSQIWLDSVKTTMSSMIEQIGKLQVIPQR